MPAIAGSPFRGLAKVVVDNAGLGTRIFTVVTNDGSVRVDHPDRHNATGDQTYWQSLHFSGSLGYIDLKYYTGTSGATPPLEANTITIEIRTPDGAQVGTLDWVNPVDGDGKRLSFGSDPFVGGANAGTGMVEIYIRAVRTDVGTYDVDSRGVGADAGDSWSQGYVRMVTAFTGSHPSNVSLGGAIPSQFIAYNPFHTQGFVWGNNTIWYRAGAVTLEHWRNGVLLRTQAGPSTAALPGCHQREWSWTAAALGTTGNGRCNKDYVKGKSAIDVRVKLPDNSFSGDREFVWYNGTDGVETFGNNVVARPDLLAKATTPDVSGNGKTLTFERGCFRTIDSKQGTLGMDFDGTVEAYAKIASAVSVSNTFTITFWAKTRVQGGNFYGTVFSSAGNAGGIFFRDDAAGTNKLSFWFSGTDHFANTNKPNDEWHHYAVKNVAGTFTFYIDGVAAGGGTGGPSLSSSLLGADSADSFGDQLNGVLDDVRIFPTALSDAQILDTKNGVTVAGSSAWWDFEGATVGWVRESEGVVLAKTALISDPTLNAEQLLQLNDNIFGTPPLSKDLASGQRLNADLGFLAARFQKVDGSGVDDGSLAWTEKLWDTGELISSEASPKVSRSSVSATKGGQKGWSDGFMTWEQGLPPGSWTQKQIITTPDMVGLESGNTRTLTLLASDPRIALKIDKTCYDNLGDHFHPGCRLHVSLSAFKSLLRVAHTAPKIALVATHTGTNKLQHLRASDYTFVDLALDAAPDVFDLSFSPNDSQLSYIVFTAAQTRNWDFKDITIVASATVGGIEYAQRQALTVLGNHNAHAFEVTA